MATRKTYQSRDYQLRLVEYPKTRRYEIQGVDLIDDTWVVNERIKISRYDYYYAQEVFLKEVRAHERDGIHFHEVF